MSVTTHNYRSSVAIVHKIFPAFLMKTEPNERIKIAMMKFMVEEISESVS